MAVDPSQMSMIQGEHSTQDEISRLKAELALAVQSRDSLESRLNKLIEPDSKCYFLEKIPIEIRNDIYRLMLFNPILGGPESIYDPDRFGYGSGREYGISPAILQTCRRINAEASSVLYEQNTFFIACVEGESGHPDFGFSERVWAEYINLSALTRYWNDHKTRNDYVQLEKLSAFRKVKN